MAQVLYILSDNLLTLDGLQNNVDGTYINAGATVTATLKSVATNGVETDVTNAVDLAMSYVGGSNGKYQVNLPYTLSLVNGGNYALYIKSIVNSKQVVSRYAWRAVYHPAT